jgi:3-oxoacyl-[acyl-carrier protein] reductase
MNPLHDKRALVCGGSQGIGKAGAIELARLGAAVTVLARRESALQAVVRELPADAGQAHQYLVADSAEPDALVRAVRELIGRVGPHHILVNNTGGPPSGLLLDATPEAFIQAISNHVICNHRLVQTLVPDMKAAGYGRIINIISTSVIAPIPGLGVSNTTRGAVANWARTMAGELAPFGITVNNVLPGYTATERLWSLFEKNAERAGTDPETVKEQAVASIPMKRLGEPAEIGTVIAFLASPAASYVTGVNLPVDGGRTALQ